MKIKQNKTMFAAFMLPMLVFGVDAHAADANELAADDTQMAVSSGTTVVEESVLIRREKLKLVLDKTSKMICGFEIKINRLNEELIKSKEIILADTEGHLTLEGAALIAHLSEGLNEAESNLVAGREIHQFLASIVGEFPTIILIARTFSAYLILLDLRGATPFDHAAG